MSFAFKLKTNTPENIIQKIQELKLLYEKQWQLHFHLFQFAQTFSDVCLQGKTKPIYFQILDCMEYWQIQTFQIPKCFSKQPHILKSLSGIKLQNLKELNLRSNRISNIENIALLDCPKLQILMIQKNIIYSLKPLAKSCFKNLKKIKYFDNYFNTSQLCYLNKLNRNSQVQLDTLFLTGCQPAHIPTIYKASQMFLNNLMKLQANCILWIAMKKKLIQSNNKTIQNAFKRRFKVSTGQYQIFLLFK